MPDGVEIRKLLTFWNFQIIPAIFCNGNKRYLYKADEVGEVGLEYCSSTIKIDFKGIDSLLMLTKRRAETMRVKNCR